MTSRADIRAGRGLKSKPPQVVKASPRRRMCNACGFTGWTCCALFFLLTILFAGLFGGYYSRWSQDTKDDGPSYDVSGVGQCNGTHTTLNVSNMYMWAQHPDPPSIALLSPNASFLTDFETRNALIHVFDDDTFTANIEKVVAKDDDIVRVVFSNIQTSNNESNSLPEETCYITLDSVDANEEQEQEFKNFENAAEMAAVAQFEKTLDG